MSGLERLEHPVPSTTVRFDPFSAEYFEDPTDVYRRLRDEAPVYHSEEYGFYALSRFADVVSAHRDWPAFSSAHGVDLAMLTRDPGELGNFRSMILMDPPDHDRYRALVSRVFSTRAVAGLEPMIRDVIRGLLDPLEAAGGTFDAVTDFAALFPVEIISGMLGVPAERRQQIRQWVDVALHREPGEMEPTREGRQAFMDLGMCFFELTQQKRREPADDMLSRLTQVQMEREDGEVTGLDDMEVANFSTLLGAAGSETVARLVANAMVLFSRHPGQWDAVRADLDLIPRAVEEVLRYVPPSQYQGRYSLEEREFDGGTIPAGRPVLLLTGAATRDPRAFERPDDFDITRKPNLAIGFGHGIHTCLGAALARLEGRIALQELAARWRRFEVDESGLRRVQMSNVAGYASVPFTGVS